MDQRLNLYSKQNNNLRNESKIKFKYFKLYKLDPKPSWANHEQCFFWPAGWKQDCTHILLQKLGMICVLGVKANQTWG